MSAKRKYNAGYGRLGKGPALTGPEAHRPVWWDRGFLPHVESPELIQHVCFRLADSLPHAVVEQIEADLKSLPPSLRAPEKQRRLNVYLNAGYGSCKLERADVGVVVQNALLHFHGTRYLLHAWCIMPNHVHVLFQTLPGWTMSRAVWSWKSYTGRLINQRCGTTPQPTSGTQAGDANQVWHREYFDRYIRDHLHYANAVHYIHHNPVKAGLVKTPEEWQWSSAYRGCGEGG